MTLAELIGPNASNPGDEAGYWRQVSRWVMGGNDDPNVGDCAFAAIANLHTLVTTVVGDAQVMPDGEVEYAYSQIAGWLPGRPETNHGARLLDVLQYWSAHGWPGDPLLKPVGWAPIAADQIHQAVHSLGAVYAWCLLPMVDEEWSFEDAALGATGEGAHAVLIVGSTPGRLYLVTWAKVVGVSRAWWERFGRDCYAVLHPAWSVR